jgi:hypothetical protein
MGQPQMAAAFLMGVMQYALRLGVYNNRDYAFLAVEEGLADPHPCSDLLLEEESNVSPTSSQDPACVQTSANS